ncbi:hypothetical protein KOI40_00705 [Aestuariicella sp. G3-2]|uniref:hypothetical protein n=1 Tax=Pseudomaricurvus albidus TaxID=2842452 RepID=UPI001C0CDB96|nr:hypothetical protein [Aestuariicella albida]MBU3068312.1 hypothetical protein [Aestuariicella albida]
MTDSAHNTNLRFSRLGSIRWILLTLLCLVGAEVTHARVDVTEQPLNAIVVTSDLNTEQAQDEQWDWDALTPAPCPVLQTLSTPVRSGTATIPRHQLLTAFIARAPPHTSPKTRILVF